MSVPARWILDRALPRTAVTAVLLFAGGIGNAAAPPEPRTVAREAAFYLSGQVSRELTGDAIRAALHRVAAISLVRDYVEVRLLGVPAACPPDAADFWQRSVGRAGSWFLQDAPRTGAEPYYLAVLGVDFGGLDLIDGRLVGSWYECHEDAGYALTTDPTGTHFVLHSGGQPLLAWSLTGRP